METLLTDFKEDGRLTFVHNIHPQSGVTQISAQLWQPYSITHVDLCHGAKDHRLRIFRCGAKCVTVRNRHSRKEIARFLSRLFFLLSIFCVDVTLFFISVGSFDSSFLRLWSRRGLSRSPGRRLLGYTGCSVRSVFLNALR